MEIKILEKAEQAQYDREILPMLIDGDEEFFPPLSARASTTQTDLTKREPAMDGVLDYFKALQEQRLLVATENGKLMGFVSYRENFTNDKISVAELPNIYISTLLVSPEARGRGLTGKMYEALFAEYENRNAFTRTWSTNVAHIKILAKFRFETMCVLKDDRGVGVDTVYFKKSAK